ncbi:MAG TPA: alpha/beta fold hydrolase, partial [Propionibacteriaceae bacterium]|nr:alpha/beta fold hydrolase [Propionibacteriaceae bacterium]
GLGNRADATDVGLRTHVTDIVSVIEGNDLRDVVLVGHSYSGIPVGQAAERIGERLTHLVFVDANVPVDGESFTEGSADFDAAITENGGFWRPLTAAEYEGQGLTDEQVARIVAGSTPHPGATLTERAALESSISELPTTYIKCLLDWPEPTETVARLLSGERWRLVTMDTAHWPMFSQPRELTQILLDATQS